MRVRIAVEALAAAVFGDADLPALWMRRPNSGLGGRTPSQAIWTASGLREVRSILRRGLEGNLPSDFLDRDIVDILARVVPWAGSSRQALAWYRSQPLPSFGDMTAQELVQQGRARDVKTYLSRIATGGYG